MKNRYLATLSLATAIILITGCGSIDVFNNDEDKVTGESVEAVAASVSNEAVKSIITWGLDGLGNPSMESNITYEYEGNKIISRESRNYSYNDVDASDKLTIKATVTISKCDVNETTDEGRVSYMKCTSTTNTPQSDGTTLSVSSTSHYRYTYSDQGYILKRETLDSNKKLTAAITYDYDSFDNNATGFKEVVIKTYSDLGKVDNAGAIVTTADGVVQEMSSKRVLNFSYNEHNDIDIRAVTQYNGVGVYYAKDPLTTADSENTMYGSYGVEGVSAMTYYIYNQDRRLDYIPNNDTTVDNNKLVYEGNFLVGQTDTIRNNNNSDLNSYTITDSPIEYMYEGNRLSKVLFGNSSGLNMVNRYTEYTYAGFENSVYAVKPIEFYLDLTPGMYGGTVYSGL